MVTMAATKKDYARWALLGSPEGFIDQEVCMYREIDDSFLAEIINEPNQAQRQKLVLEIVGDRIGFIDVIDRADKALYIAKNSGRNCVKSEKDI